MSGAGRFVVAGLLGFSLGYCLGPISMFAIHARDVLRGGEEWPSWSPDYRTGLLLLAIPAGVNGAIGAAVAAHRGRQRATVVTAVPAALHVFTAVLTLVFEPQSLVGVQLYTLAFTVVIWSAGRVGQSLGSRLAPADCRPFSIQRLREHLRGLTEQQREAIRQTARAGRSAEAIQKTERLLGVSLGTASEVVEELQR